MNQTATNPVRAIAILAALVIGSFLLLVSFTFPEGNRTFSAIQNFGHFLLFALLAWAALSIVLGFFRRQAVAVAVTGIVLMLLGLGVELFQTGLANRSASMSDFALDVLGILVGCLFFFLVKFFRQGRKYQMFTVGFFLLFLTTIALRPLIPLIGYDLMRADLPVVRSFNHPFAEQKIESVGGAIFKKLPSRVLAGSNAECCTLHVSFSTARYSGVVFEEDASLRAGSWSDFESLNIKVFSSLRNTRQIALRINDRLHNNLYEDRYNSVLSISPGLNEITVPLQQIASMGRVGNSGRTMDVNDVTRIQLFTSEVENQFTLQVLSIELE